MKKVLSPTRTTITQTNNFLSIYTEYVGRLKDIIAFISLQVKTLNNVPFIEGELGIINDGYDEVNFSLNQNGDLIVVGENTSRFNIDSIGQLTITE